MFIFMEGDNLEKLKGRLYKKKEEFQERKRENFYKIYNKTEPPSPPYWISTKKEKKTFKFMKNIFGILFLFFLIIIGVGYFLFFSSNIISSKNVNLEIKGPVYEVGGKLANFHVFIENKNKTSLELADLIFEFSDGSFLADGSSLPRLRLSVGKIETGAIIDKSIDVFFLGMENDEKKINVTLEYRLADSNAIFAKSAEYSIKLSSPAFGVSLDIPKEINARQEINIKAEVVSNSDLMAKNIFLKVDYPAGFQFISADPKPVEGNNVWSLGDFNSLQKREVFIKGFLEGQDLEERFFNVSAGMLGDDRIMNVYGAAAETVVIKKTPLNLTMFIDSQDLEKNVFYTGKTVGVDLRWLNNLPTAVRDAKIEAEIKGLALDESSISIEKGFYRPFDKKIVWNSSTYPEFNSIAPGQKGFARFNFSLQDILPANTTSDKNFSLKIEAVISGFGTYGELENTEITDSVEKNIKVASKLDLSSYSLYYSGQFSNTGPMPPKIGDGTTYTVVWSLGGNSNDFSNAKVSASLPVYIKWLGAISPSDSDVKFNERNGTIIWNAGYIPAGAGIVTPAKEIAFQISFTPAPGQEGASPILVSESKIESLDNFTGDVFTGQSSLIDIMLNNDSKFKYNEGKVVK